MNWMTFLEQLEAVLTEHGKILNPEVLEVDQH